MIRAAARVVVVALCFLLIVSPPLAAQIPGLPTDTDTAKGCSNPGVDDRCEAWAATYHDPEAGAASSQFPSGAAVSADGSTVFLAVQTTTGSGFDSKSTWGLVSYDALTGAKRWETRWGDPTRYSLPTAVATGRGFVFATGTSRNSFGDPESQMTTIAFDEKNGNVVWRAGFDGPGGTDGGRWLQLSPDKRTLYVGAVSANGASSDLDYALVAYDVATGEELFVTRYAGVDKGETDSPFGMAVSPSGDLVYLTGWSAGHGQYNVDYGTIAVRATGPDAGTIAWEARYDGTGASAPDRANGIAVSSDGQRVFVTGMTSNVNSGPPFAVDYSYGTVAYDALTGQQIWEARRDFDDANFNEGTAIAADAAGRVFVTGQSQKSGPDNDVATVAYDGTTGQELWSERYGLPQHDLELGKAIAVSPRADAVYITGMSSSARTKALYANQTQNGDQLTLAYDPATGGRIFTARYNATGYDYDVGRDAVVSPDGSMLYLAASLKHNIDFDSNFYDAGLIAYEAGESVPPPPEEEETSLAFTDRSERSAQYTDSAYFEARLTDDSGAPLASRQVTFTLGEGSSARSFSSTTDENGVAGVTTAIEERPGTHPLTAAYQGDGSYSSSEATTTFTVLKEDTQMTLEVAGNGSNRTITARLTDADSGTGVANRTVDFYEDGQHLGSAATDADGVAVLDAPPGSRGGKRTFEARFAGDDFFEGSQASASTGTGKPYV